MSSQPDRLLRIEVTVKASQPELLEGLDVWLRLGLISHAQVRRLSQIYLTCLLPHPAVVVFWLGGIWAGKQRHLQLTSQTLRLITLLLVPVNFWAMDSFGLWRHPWEWLVVAIAAFTLTANTVLHPEMRNHPSRLTSDSLLLLLLSYLHWGWHLPGFPLVAVYIGMLGTAMLLPRGLAKEEGENLST